MTRNDLTAEIGPETELGSGWMEGGQARSSHEMRISIYVGLDTTAALATLRVWDSHPEPKESSLSISEFKVRIHRSGATEESDRVRGSVEHIATGEKTSFVRLEKIPEIIAIHLSEPSEASPAQETSAKYGIIAICRNPTCGKSFTVRDNENPKDLLYFPHIIQAEMHIAKELLWDPKQAPRPADHVPDALRLPEYIECPKCRTVFYQNALQYFVVHLQD